MINVLVESLESDHHLFDINITILFNIHFSEQILVNIKQKTLTNFLVLLFYFMVRLSQWYRPASQFIEVKPFYFMKSRVSISYNRSFNLFLDISRFTSMFISWINFILMSVYLQKQNWISQLQPKDWQSDKK